MMTSALDLPFEQIQSWVTAEHAKCRPMKEIVAELTTRDDVTLLSANDSSEITHQKIIDSIRKIEARDDSLLNQPVTEATPSIPTQSQWLALCEQVKTVAQLGFCVSDLSVENDWLKVEANSCQDQTPKQVFAICPEGHVQNSLS